MPGRGGRNEGEGKEDRILLQLEGGNQSWSDGKYLKEDAFILSRLAVQLGFGLRQTSVQSSANKPPSQKPLHCKSCPGAASSTTAPAHVCAHGGAPRARNRCPTWHHTSELLFSPANPSSPLGLQMGALQICTRTLVSSCPYFHVIVLNF